MDQRPRRYAVGVLLAIAVGAALVLVFVEPAQRIAGQWWRQDLTADRAVLGHAVRTWGRVGKALQFAAGCSVLLDLIDPDDLRAWGRRLKDRADDLRAAMADRLAAYPLHAFAESLGASLIAPVGVVVDSGDDVSPPGVVYEWRIVDAAPPSAAALGIYAGLSDTELRRWHRDVRAALPSAHECASRCGIDRETCRAQRACLKQAIGDLTDRYAGPGEREILGRAKPQPRAFWLVVALVLGLLACCGTGRVDGDGTVDDMSPADWFWTSSALALLVLTGVALVAATRLPVVARAPLRSRIPAWIYAVPASRLALGLAGILDQARPGHAFRWIAFVLFTIGCALDLFAS